MFTTRVVNQAGRNRSSAANMSKTRLRFDVTLSLPIHGAAGDIEATEDVMFDDDEMLCGPCEEKKQKVVSSVFCVMCQEYFCPQCERVHADKHDSEGIIRKKGLHACQVTCCVQHVDRTVLVIDELNKKLKRLHNETNEVMNFCHFEETPHRVCSLDDHEIAVSLDNRQVQFILILGTVMVMRNRITYNHVCRAMACHGEEMYIADRDTIFVHKKDGKLIRKLAKFGRNPITDIQNLCISRDGQRLYFTDFQEGLFTIDPLGKIINKYSGPGLDGACGLCPVGCSGVLACGYESKSFIQFDADGQKRGNITNMGKHVKKPVAICFDRSRMKLWVAQKKSDAIAVMDLTEAGDCKHHHH